MKASIWHRWLPGSYSVVFLVHATSLAVLISFDKVWLAGLMLPIVGVGCVVAFLWRKARCSSHALSACGCATLSWVALMLESPCLISVDCHPETSLASAVICIAAVLNVAGHCWMLLLVASLLGLLEKSSNQKYCSGFVRKLVWVQPLVLGPSLVLPSAFLQELLIVFSELSTNLVIVMTIRALTLSIFQLRKIMHNAEGLNDTTIPARSSLRLARDTTILQLMLLFLYFLIRISVVALSAEYEYTIVTAWRELVKAVLLLLMSGSHRVANADLCTNSMDARQQACCRCPAKSSAVPAKERDVSLPWTAKAGELSLRGMTLRSLLQFYQQDLPSMPDWRYVPKDHKTRDVVRRAIIPLTCAEGCAFAVSSLNRDGAQRAAVMVTHNWSNVYKDLLAAVVSDALQECSFHLATRLLEGDCELLCKILSESGRLDDTYWVCAFAVNQHNSICHTNPGDRDPITNELHPVCNCRNVNISDPDGTSVASEINKFDDVMYHLAAAGGCRQVIAADESFDLFNRAWCVAEMAEAKRLRMPMSLKVSSRTTIMKCAHALQNLDVRSMRATSETDKELILDKIRSTTDIDKFNAELQSLIFDPQSGLLASWTAMDSLQRIAEVGRLLRWGRADAGTGKVWRAWEAHE